MRILVIFLLFLLKIVATVFFAFLGGIGLAAGFAFFKFVQTRFNQKKNVEYIAQLEKQVQEQLAGNGV